jgi:glycosyltransferase involved in cell wall biosynthesis
MRIAFMIYGSLDTVSGGFIYDRALVTALRALGHEIDVIGLPWRGYAEAVARHLACGPRKTRGLPGVAPPPDVVIQDELIHPSVFRQVRQDRGHAIAPRGHLTVALVHNLLSGQPRESFRALKAAIERRYFATVDGMIAVCARTLADVRALVGRELPAVIAYPGRDHVAPAVDRRLVDDRSAAPGPLRVLYAAAVAPHKGLHRLLGGLARALKSHHDFDFRLDVVGSLAHRSYVRAMRGRIVDLGMAERVQLHGELHGAELQQMFRGSHVLALPSDREAYSLASLEALGFGLPVLGPSVGGLDEMFTDGEAGYLLEPDRLDDWSEALRSLGSDRARLAKMGGAALARYQAHARWQDVAVTVQDFLRECLRECLPEHLARSNGADGPG